MSVELSSVPPWKQALIEKKRRQDLDERPCLNTEADKISALPSWKRDILSKKQTNSRVFLGDRQLYSRAQNSSPKDSSNAKEIDGKLRSPTTDLSKPPDLSRKNPEPDRGSEGCGDTTPSFVHNPWLKADAAFTKKRPKHGNRNSDPIAMADIQLNHVSHNNHSWSETDGVLYDKHNNKEISDEVFQDEEVTYGRGFVHKLLKRFSHMSSNKEDEDKKIKPSSNRLSRSSENLLSEDAGQLSPRSSSPPGSCVDSLSPRSHNRSRSSDSLTSPREETNKSENTILSGTKMGYVDKAGISTSKVISQDNNNDTCHAGTSDDSTQNSHNDTDGHDHSDRENLPKNIVSSTRNVFENFISAQPYRKPVIVSPRGHSSKSVHTLIAVESLPQDDSVGSFDSSPLSSPTLQNKNSDELDKASLAFGIPKNIQDDAQSYRSRYFAGSSKPQKTSSRSYNDKKTDVKLSESNRKQDKNANDMYYTASDNEITSKNRIENVNGTSTNSVGISHSPVNSIDKTNSHIPSTNGYSYLLKAESEKVDKSEGNYQGSVKKRKAPSPPSSSRVDAQRDQKKPHVAPVDNSKPSVIRRSTPKAESKTSVNVQSSKLNNTGISKSDANKKADVSRNRLSLDLNKVEKRDIVSSKPVKENPANVIYNRNGTKAKFKVPKSTGPGSLLIRPASNMVQGKNAGLVSLEFKYKDIKKGEFAAAKKRPAYYEEYSDASDEEDILVTNIDDVIQRNNISTMNEKTKRAEPSKTRKFDFIGQGVLLEKSSMKSRQLKMKITFADHATQTYEYPSQQSLLDSMPAEPGDFDHPDTVYNTVSTPSDEEIPDMDEPVASLKSTPGVGSGGSLSGYQTKMQVEFSFGMNPMDTEVKPSPTRNQVTESTQVVDDELVKPADEEDTFQWSENKNSDLLF